MRRLLTAVALCLLALPLAAQGRPLTVDEFLQLDRPGEPQVSPDGKWVAYTVTTTSLADNRRQTDLWLAAFDGTGEPRRISTDALGGRAPRWSPDGTRIAYVNARGGTPQVRVYDVASGAHRQ